LNTWRLLLTLFQVQHLESEKVDNIVSDRDLADALFKEDQKLKGVILVCVIDNKKYVYLT